MPLVLTLAVSATVFGQPAPQDPQPPQPPQAPQPFADFDAARMNADAARMAAEDARMAVEAMKMDFNFDLAGVNGLKSQLAFLQNPQPKPPVPPRVRVIYGRDSAQYDTGTRLLDDRKYTEAIASFDRVIAAKADRADGALYWKAYALNRLGQRDEALAAIATLRRDYAASHWLNDAQVLEAEVKQNGGHPVSPADETNEDIKLMAINSLMNADPDQAIPLLEGLLKKSSSPKLKEKVLFVLTQNRSPKAEQILTDYAKGAGNPDLQVRAVRYIGMSGTAESQQQLVAIYGASNDVGVKREILRSLSSGAGKEQLFNLAKNESNAELRIEAIRQMGALRATDQLVRLYTPDLAPEVKTEIIRALTATGSSDKLLELARAEKDANVRMEVVRDLAATKSTSADSLLSMYTADSDARTKRALINGLHSRGDAKPLIEVFRKETDPTMKKYIVQQLAEMRNNKEATDFMLELLK
jgi:HEAT repeat protein